MPRLWSSLQGSEATFEASISLGSTCLGGRKKRLSCFQTRDQQEFVDKGPEFYKQWGQHFGRLHIDPASGHPAGYPEFHLVYSRRGSIIRQQAIHKEDHWLEERTIWLMNITAWIGKANLDLDTILKFLFDHIDKSADLQARVKWEPNSVVIWDNRITAHSAVVDYGDSKERRHGLRITPQAERPVGAEELELSG